MNRQNFVHRLQELQDEVLVMGSMVDKALRQAMAALKNRDHNLANSVIEDDKEINRQRFAIEEQTLTLIATQQPVVAHDLRLVAAVLNIISELERMGDHAKGIARINQLLQDQPLVKPLIDLQRMAAKCSLMLKAVLDAFIQKDAEAAKAVARADDEIDLLYDRVYRDLIQIMTSDPQTINQATYLLWAAHNLERFGDRITNICERIIFIITGEMTEIVGHREEGQEQNSAGIVAASARQELEG